MKRCKGWRRVRGVSLRLGGGVVLALSMGCAPEPGAAGRLERAASAVYSPGAGRLFVLYRDAAGSGIARLGLDGRVEARRWRGGFEAGAVLAARGDDLYVADGPGLWRFDARGGELLDHVFFEGARLTDLTVDGHGLVYALDSSRKRVLRLAGHRALPLSLPPRTHPLAILHEAGALWILLAGQRPDEQWLLRRRPGDADRLRRLRPVGDRALLLGLAQQRIGLFDPATQRLRRFDGNGRELSHWRIPAAVRPAQLPGGRLAIPEPGRDRVRIWATPDRLLADTPRAFGR